jgi:hypothetical protein
MATRDASTRGHSPLGSPPEQRVSVVGNGSSKRLYRARGGIREQGNERAAELLGGEPSTVLSVTQNWNPGGGPGVYNDHPVGVRYGEKVRKWSVYNEDGARMPVGASFNVAFLDASEGER